MVLDRLKQGDIDLMMSLGTWAGQDLANNEHNIPTVAASVSDALASNIIKSAEDSGYDHLHGKIDLKRNTRQIKLFHDIIQFNRLGMVYENTREGRSHAAVQEAKQVARERNFEIVPCYATFSNVPLEQAQKEVTECYTNLAHQVDAVYITRHRGLLVEQILQPLIEARVPTFSQQGSRDVRVGVLLSIALAGHRYVGMFYGETIAKIFNGAQPRQLTQIFEEPPKIAINIQTAKAIGFEPPIEIFGIADEIYQ